jgi:hypothetical protein
MKKPFITIIIALILVMMIAIFLSSCTSGAATQAASGVSSIDGKTLMQERCSVCHSLDRIITAHKTAAEWTTTVDRMISHGAQLNSQEKQTLIDYLAATYK